MQDRYRFTIRWDVNNPTKQPQLADPGGQLQPPESGRVRPFRGHWARQLLRYRHSADAPCDCRPLRVLVPGVGVAKCRLKAYEKKDSIWFLGLPAFFIKIARPKPSKVVSPLTRRKRER